LLSNYPNPFNPTTTISFSLTAKDAKNAKIEIYNIKGQKIKTLVGEQLDVGEHLVVWDGKDENNNPVSSGIYFYKLNVNGKTEAVKKCLLLK
jgi:flagellar hook assembly protein FlgD